MICRFVVRVLLRCCEGQECMLLILGVEGSVVKVLLWREMVLGVMLLRHNLMVYCERIVVEGSSVL